MPKITHNPSDPGSMRFRPYLLRGELSRCRKLGINHQKNMAKNQWMVFCLPFRLAWNNSLRKFFRPKK